VRHASEDEASREDLWESSAIWESAVEHLVAPSFSHRSQSGYLNPVSLQSSFTNLDPASGVRVKPSHGISLTHPLLLLPLPFFRAVPCRADPTGALQLEVHCLLPRTRARQFLILALSPPQRLSRGEEQALRLSYFRVRVRRQTAAPVPVPVPALLSPAALVRPRPRPRWHSRRTDNRFDRGCDGGRLLRHVPHRSHRRAGAIGQSQFLGRRSVQEHSVEIAILPSRSDGSGSRPSISGTLLLRRENGEGSFLLRVGDGELVVLYTWSAGGRR
jgi:hypothetical protein